MVQWQCNIVNGRPRHSQSQGLVERGNRVVQDKIAAIKRDEGYEGELSYPWALWLPRIMFNMNIQWHSTIKDVPYNLVFGQLPHPALFPGASTQIVTEEDLGSIATSPVTSKPSSETTSPSSVVQVVQAKEAPSSCPISPFPEIPAKTWVEKKHKVLNWAASPASSPTATPLPSPLSELPSLPSSPTISDTATATQQHPNPEPPVADIVY